MVRQVFSPNKKRLSSLSSASVSSFSATPLVKRQTSQMDVSYLIYDEPHSDNLESMGTQVEQQLKLDTEDVVVEEQEGIEAGLKKELEEPLKNPQESVGNEDIQQSTSGSIQEAPEEESEQSQQIVPSAVIPQIEDCQQRLFVIDDRPMVFTFLCVRNKSDRQSMKDLIQRHGGEYVEVSVPECIHLVDANASLVYNRRLPEVAYTTDFILQCVLQKHLVDLEAYRFTYLKSPTGRKRSVLQGTRLSRGNGRRNFFTHEEDLSIFLTFRREQKNGASLGGNDVYKRYESDFPGHTWQSVRDRFLKRILPKLESRSEAEVLAELRMLAERSHSHENVQIVDEPGAATDQQAELPTTSSSFSQVALAPIPSPKRLPPTQTDSPNIESLGDPSPPRRNDAASSNAVADLFPDDLDEDDVQMQQYIEKQVEQKELSKPKFSPPRKNHDKNHDHYTPTPAARPVASSAQMRKTVHVVVTPRPTSKSNPTSPALRASAESATPKVAFMAIPARTSSTKKTPQMIASFSSSVKGKSPLQELPLSGKRDFQTDVQSEAIKRPRFQRSIFDRPLEPLPKPTDLFMEQVLEVAEEMETTPSTVLEALYLTSGSWPKTKKILWQNQQEGHRKKLNLNVVDRDLIFTVRDDCLIYKSLIEGRIADGSADEENEMPSLPSYYSHPDLKYPCDEFESQYHDVQGMLRVRGAGVVERRASFLKAAEAAKMKRLEAMIQHELI